MSQMPQKTSSDEDTIPSNEEKNNADVHVEILDTDTAEEPKFDRTRRSLKVCASCHSDVCGILIPTANGLPRIGTYNSLALGVR